MATIRAASGQRGAGERSRRPSGSRRALRGDDRRGVPEEGDRGVGADEQGILAHARAEAGNLVGRGADLCRIGLDLPRRDGTVRACTPTLKSKNYLLDGRQIEITTTHYV